MMKIKMTSVYVPNPNEAIRYYTEVLGFVKLLHLPDAKLAIVRSPEQPDGPGLLLEPNENPIASTYQKALYDARIPVITMGVENVQREYDRLLALGVQFKKEPTKTEWGTEAVFDDTCGNFIQLHQD